ncbi:translocation and assembly module TamA precursor [bacterium BMS3Abin04]|nr:translocation and assembly module TamA precursor [bacterium BMS3Abin04]
MKFFVKYYSKFKYFNIAIIFILLYFLSFNISKAQKNNYELTDIEFVGNHFISSSTLSNVITSKESPGWFSKFLNSFSGLGENAVFFDSLLITIDIESMKNYYMSQGFFNSKISSIYRLNKSEEEARLIYFIVEGNPSKIRNIKIKGLTKISKIYQSEIQKDIMIDSNTYYSDAIVDNNNNFIINFLHDHGYMLAKAKVPEADIDTIKNIVDLVLSFAPGKKYKISKVEVERTGVGQELVTDKLIEDIANIKVGSNYSLYDMKKAQIRLYRTNLFTSALVRGVVGDTSGNLVPIKISTDVGLLHELAPEIIGINEDNSFKLGLGLSFTKKNFLGDARKFTFRLSAAAQNIADFISNLSINDKNIFGFADARLSLEQPFLFNKPINTKLETNYTLQKKKQEYNAQIIGTQLNLNFELAQYTYLDYLSAYLKFENSKYIFQNEYIKKIDSLSQGSINISGQIVSKSTNVLLGVQFGANKTNNYIFPSRGYGLSLTLEEGNSIPYLLSKVGGYNFNSPLYYKILFTSSAYLPVYKNENSAFGIKLKTGLINVYNGNKFDIPLNQRFIAGGSNSVRGWKTGDLVPQNNANKIPENPTREELERSITPGGFFLFEGSIESRNHLFGNFGSAVFLDFGNTWNSYQEFRYDETAVAFGFGLRYYSSFAPIRIDLGMKLYDPLDRRNIFNRLKDAHTFRNNFTIQLGIGEAF